MYLFACVEEKGRERAAMPVAICIISYLLANNVPEIIKMPAVYMIYCIKIVYRFDSCLGKSLST